MPLLADYAITPDVFDITSYSSEEVCGLRLELIREPILTEGLVRDLRAGEWRRLFRDNERPWHNRGKELVKKLAIQGRLLEFQPRLRVAPADDLGWCAEALSSRDTMPFNGGIIATKTVKDNFAGEQLVGRIDRLGTAPWWQGRRNSIRLPRSLAAYQQHLTPVLRFANSLCFVDPHLDPAKHQYRDFATILEGVGRRRPSPLIEIHRVCYEGSGENREILDYERLEENYRRVLTALLQANGLRANVFIWDDFHDRYLISNLIGISMPNGFDTTHDPNDITTWTRLERDDRDDVQREFDLARSRHKLRHRFKIL